MLGKFDAVISRVHSILFLMTLASMLLGTAYAQTVMTQGAFLGDNGAIFINGNLLYNNNYIYGVTYAGGEKDFGTVFQLSSSTQLQTQNVLYSFSDSDGSRPNGSLIADAQGNLYGTTNAGGAAGLGTIFKLTNPHAGNGSWVLTLLHSFTGPDGANPVSGLTMGPGGVLYGTAANGGIVPCVGDSFLGGGAPVFANGCGTVFTITASGAFHLLHVFNGHQADAGGPQTNVVVDPAGNVIGTTAYSTQPYGSGVVYKLTPSGVFSHVSDFYAKALLGYPIGNIVRDSAGNIYGTTEFSGGENGPDGAGIFEITAVTHEQLLLAQLLSQASRSGVVRDQAGNLYGTTIDGGANHAGSVFRLDPMGRLTTVASLGLSNLAPIGGVILDPAGNFWGTSSASFGQGSGAAFCPTAASVGVTGCGTVFSVTP